MASMWKWMYSTSATNELCPGVPWQDFFENTRGGKTGIKHDECGKANAKNSHQLGMFFHKAIPQDTSRARILCCTPASPRPPAVNSATLRSHVAQNSNRPQSHWINIGCFIDVFLLYPMGNLVSYISKNYPISFFFQFIGAGNRIPCFRPTKILGIFQLFQLVARCRSFPWVVPESLNPWISDLWWLISSLMICPYSIFQNSDGLYPHLVAIALFIIPSLAGFWFVKITSNRMLQPDSFHSGHAQTWKKWVHKLYLGYIIYLYLD